MLDNEFFDPEKISILEFKFIKGQVETPEGFEVDKVQGNNVENSLQFGFNIEDKLVKADFQITLKTNSSGKNSIEASGIFHLVYIYKVENLEKLATIVKENHLDINPWLANALASITYSTSRGVLITRLQGTAFQGFMLPVIDPNKLL